MIYVQVVLFLLFSFCNGFELKLKAINTNTFDVKSFQQSLLAPNEQAVSGIAFTGNLQYGTPPQKLTVAVDSNSPYTWIVGSKCKNTFCLPFCEYINSCDVYCDAKCCKGAEDTEEGPCKGKNKFDGSASSTFVDTKVFWSQEFGNDIGKVVGKIGNDILTLGDDTQTFTAQDIKIPIVTALPKLFTGLEIDGIMGLSLHGSDWTGLKSIFEQAVEKGTYDNNSFTVWLNKKSDGPEGTITYGRLNNVHCRATNLKYFPLKSKTKWVFQIDALKTPSKIVENKSLVWINFNSPYTVLPSAIMADLVLEIEAKQNENGLYEVDCAKKFSYGIIMDGRAHEIDQSLLTYKQEDKCILSILGVDFPKQIGAQILLGQNFAKQYCQIYDPLNEQIGFALAK